MTPSEIAALSACFSCIADRQAALLFLLARIANVTIDQINAGAACYRCVADFTSAELFLLNTIATNAAAAAGQVTCGAGAPVAAPANSCAIYYDTTNDAVYIYRGGAWVLKV